jgi:HSP20 family protein
MGDMRAEMQQLRDEMNRIFGRFGEGVREFTTRAFPPLNLWEDAGNYFVEAELPGFQLADLEIYVTGNSQLSVKGDRKQPEIPQGTWHRQERGYGPFSRIMDLPGPVDSDQVSAEFRNGVLTIRLPKREEAKPRRIEVKTS